MLGSLEAESDLGLVPIGGPCERKLLAALLLDSGRVVPLTRLVDVLWDGKPPATADKQVRDAMSRLRQALADGGAPGLLVTCAGGYQLAVERDAVDAGVFEARVEQARRAAGEGQADEASQLLESALELWRGPFLAGIDGMVIGAASSVWDEWRCAAAEELYDHQLALGRHHELVAALRAFAGSHPLRDTPVRQLMLALYRCGRQAAALAEYERVRVYLAEGLGLDPSPALQRLRQQILTFHALASEHPDTMDGGDAVQQRPGCRNREATGPAGTAAQRASDILDLLKHSDAEQIRARLRDLTQAQ